jgi:putative PEP-CTERM system TPR-repeat lipoprotein
MNYNKSMNVWMHLFILATSLALGGCDAWVGADERVERARKTIEQGDYRAAMTDIKTALEREPAHAEGRVLLAEVSAWLGDFETADKEIEKALQAGATVERVREARYQTLLELQRHDELQQLLQQDASLAPERKLLYEARLALAKEDAAGAEERLAEAYRLAPKDADIMLERARVLAARGDTAPALDLPAQLTAEQRQRGSALLLRGTVLLQQGKQAEARDALTQALDSGNRSLTLREQLITASALTEVRLALGQVDEAEQSLRFLSGRAPDAVATLYLRARVAMAKGDALAAINDAQRALAAAPDHVPSQMLLAAAHLSRKSYEQAEEVLDRVISTNPQNLAARKLLAQVHLGRNRPDLARQVLGAAGAEVENDPQANWLLGAALLQGGSGAEGLSYLERGFAGFSQDPRRAIELAAAYVSQNMPDKAVPLLKSVPAQASDFPRAQALLVLATAAGKSREDALRAIDALTASHDRDATLLAAAGSYLSAIGETDRAGKLLRRSIEIDPRNVQGHFALAGLGARAGDMTLARRELNEVLKLDQSHEAARVYLAQLAWREGSRDEARKWLEDAVAASPSSVESRLRLAQIAFIDGDARRGKDLLDQAVSVATDRKVVLHRAGKVLAQAGLQEDALARFQEAGAAGLDEALLSAAQVQLGLNRIREARQLAESAFSRQPSSVEAQRLLVRIDAQDGQIDRALTRARALAGTSGRPVGELEGDTYALAGKLDDALKSYEAAQRAKPNAALAIKIFNARRVTKKESPERSLIEWLEKEPADQGVRRLLAQHYEGSGQRREAMAQYERLIATGKDALAMNNLAWMLAEAGDARALDLAKRAHEQAPGVAEIADTYGWILVRTDKVAEGVTVLERARAQAPTNPDIQFHLASAYAKAGRQDQARDLLRALLATDRSFPSRREAEQLAQSMAPKGR